MWNVIGADTVHGHLIQTLQTSALHYLLDKMYDKQLPSENCEESYLKSFKRASPLGMNPDEMELARVYSSNYIALLHWYSLAVGLRQPTGHWFSCQMPVMSLVTVGREDPQGPTKKCYIIWAVIQSVQSFLSNWKKCPRSASVGYHGHIFLRHFLNPDGVSDDTFDFPTGHVSYYPMCTEF